MKKDVHPAVIAVVVVFVLGILGVVLMKVTKPAYYYPSPGAGGRPARSAPSYGKAPGDAKTQASASGQPDAGAAPPQPTSTGQQYQQYPPGVTSTGQQSDTNTGPKTYVLPPPGSRAGDPHSIPH